MESGFCLQHMLTGTVVCMQAAACLLRRTFDSRYFRSRKTLGALLFTLRIEDPKHQTGERKAVPIICPQYLRSPLRESSLAPAVASLAAQLNSPSVLDNAYTHQDLCRFHALRMHASSQLGFHAKAV